MDSIKVYNQGLYKGIKAYNQGPYSTTKVYIMDPDLLMNARTFSTWISFVSIVNTESRSTRAENMIDMNQPSLKDS